MNHRRCFSTKTFNIQPRQSKYLCYLFRPVIRPFEVNGTPGKTATESSQYDIIALFKFAFPFIETHGNGTVSGIAIALDIDHHLFFFKTHASSRCVNNTKVGLMWNQPGNIIGSEVIFFMISTETSAILETANLNTA